MPQFEDRFCIIDALGLLGIRMKAVVLVVHSAGYGLFLQNPPPPVLRLIFILGPDPFPGT